MDPRTRRLAEESIGKLLLSFSLPAIAGMLVSSLYVAIDRAFLGNAVGADAIGGLSVCMPIAFIMMAVGMLIGVGSGALVSIRLGEQKPDEAEVILGNALTMILIASVALTSVFLFWLEPLLRVFGATERTLPHAVEFMRVILFGSFFQYTTFSLNAIIRAEGNPRLAMLTQFIAAGLNIVFDAVLILGFKFGVTGAAVATIAAQGVSALWTLAHFRSSRSVLKLRWRNLVPRTRVLLPALGIGLSPCSMHLAGSLVTVLINRGLAKYGGDNAISAYGVIGSLAMLVLMPVFGINQGAQPIIGFNHGAGNVARVRKTLKLAMVAATAILGAGFVLVQVFPSALIRGFAPDPGLIAVGTRGMRICLLMMPVIGIQVVGANFFQAIGKAKIAMVLTLSRQVIVLIPLLLVLPGMLGLDGVWGAGPISDGLAALVTAVALGWQLRQMGRVESAAA